MGDGRPLADSVESAVNEIHGGGVDLFPRVGRGSRKGFLVVCGRVRFCLVVLIFGDV